MKKAVFYSIFLFFILILFKENIFAQAKDAKAKVVTTATITYIQGVVEVKRIGTKDWIPAKLKMILHEKDKIRTKLISNAEVQFEDGSIVKIGENTVVDIKKLALDRETNEQEFSLKLWLGKIRAKIRKLRHKSSRFEIITPTAIVGVRGTIFIVCVEEDKTTKAIVEIGEVYFRGIRQPIEEEIILKSEEFSVSSPDGTRVTPPQKITPSELEKIKEGIREIKTPLLEEEEIDPPSIRFPKKGSILSKKIINIKGISKPKVKINLSVEEGENYTTFSDERGNWSIENISLPEGRSIIKVFAQKDDLISEIVSSEIVTDTIIKPPKIITPTPGKILDSIFLDLTGNSEPLSRVDLKINNMLSFSTKADEEGYFSFEKLPLSKPSKVKISYNFSNQNRFVSQIPKLFLNISATPPNNIYQLTLTATDKAGNVSEPIDYKFELIVPINLIIEEQEVQLFGPIYSYTYEPNYWEIGHNRIDIIAYYEGGIKEKISVSSPYYDPISPIILTKNKDLKEIEGKNYLVINITVMDEGSGIYKVTANDQNMTKIGDQEYEWSYPNQIFRKDISIRLMVEDWAGNQTIEYLYYPWKQIKEEFNIDIPPLPY